jgi:hypothetical protein
MSFGPVISNALAADTLAGTSFVSTGATVHVLFFHAFHNQAPGDFYNAAARIMPDKRTRMSGHAA